jgi:hypothetical protein
MNEIQPYPLIYMYFEMQKIEHIKYFHAILMLINAMLIVFNSLTRFYCHTWLEFD